MSNANAYGAFSFRLLIYKNKLESLKKCIVIRKILSNLNNIRHGSKFYVINRDNSYLKTPLSGLFGRYSMNEKCGSKQTNFERTWICNKKFNIWKLRKQSFTKNRKWQKQKKVFRTRPKKPLREVFRYLWLNKDLKIRAQDRRFTGLLTSPFRKGEG